MPGDARPLPRLSLPVLAFACAAALSACGGGSTATPSDTGNTGNTGNDPGDNSQNPPATRSNQWDRMTWDDGAWG